MAIISFVSTLNYRSLIKRSRSDLTFRLSELARDKRLKNGDIADAILYLARRLPEDKE